MAAKKAKKVALPDNLYVVRVNANTDDEYLSANENIVDVLDSFDEGQKVSVGMYKRVDVKIGAVIRSVELKK
jgi:hypothetical protein